MSDRVSWCWLMASRQGDPTVDLEIDRVDRSILSRVESIDRVDSSRVDRLSRSSEREVESVDNIYSKSTFGSGI